MSSACQMHVKCMSHEGYRCMSSACSVHVECMYNMHVISMLHACQVYEKHLNSLHLTCIWHAYNCIQHNDACYDMRVHVMSCYMHVMCMQHAYDMQYISHRVVFYMWQIQTLDKLCKRLQLYFHKASCKVCLESVFATYKIQGKFNFGRGVLFEITIIT